MYDDEYNDSYPASSGLAPCDICGRTFIPETLVKHERICAKNSKKTRKVFHSGKQRAEGSDVPLSKVIKSDAPPPKVGSDHIPTKKNNWRAKHEDFVNTIRAARGVQVALKTGGPLPPPPPPTINPDYVQCPTCNRRFNEKAAERHMGFCAEKNKRIPDKKTIDPAAQRRMQARVNFKGVKSRKSPKEDVMSNGYGNNHSVNNSSRNDNGPDSGIYGSPMRTGKTEVNYKSGLAMRSNSLDRRKGSSERRSGNMPRINSHESITRIPQDQGSDPGSFYSPSPPGSGRPPSGSYQHRMRDIGSGGTSANRANARNRHGYGQQTSILTSSKSKFCHDCGFKYCRSDAQFCCECGVRRLVI